MKALYISLAAAFSICISALSLNMTGKPENPLGPHYGIETLADGEYPGDYEFGEYCRCKYGSCKAGNSFSFRKWCLGTEPGVIVNCADYDDGCE